MFLQDDNHIRRIGQAVVFFLKNFLLLAAPLHLISGTPVSNTLNSIQKYLIPKVSCRLKAQYQWLNAISTSTKTPMRSICRFQNDLINF